MKVSRSLRDLAYKAIQSRERLTVKLQREPDMDEIAADIGEKRADVVIALESISDPVSLYEPVYSNSEDTVYIMDQIGDRNDVESKMDELSIRDAIKDLGEREKRILYLRFLKGRTQTEVAGEIGISQAQVSRLKRCYKPHKGQHLTPLLPIGHIVQNTAVFRLFTYFSLDILMILDYNSIELIFQESVYMSKIKGFFANLKKSTKITLVSCGCFIAMTAVILGFFIMFPITPSDKVIASFGRESVIKKDASQSQAVTTTVTALDSIEASKGTTYMTTAVTTMRTTRRREFSVDITTGSGFYSAEISSPVFMIQTTSGLPLQQLLLTPTTETAAVPNTPTPLSLTQATPSIQTPLNHILAIPKTLSLSLRNPLLSQLQVLSTNPLHLLTQVLSLNPALLIPAQVLNKIIKAVLSDSFFFCLIIFQAVSLTVLLSREVKLSVHRSPEVPPGAQLYSC